MKRFEIKMSLSDYEINEVILALSHTCPLEEEQATVHAMLKAIADDINQQRKAYENPNG